MKFRFQNSRNDKEDEKMPLKALVFQKDILCTKKKSSRIPTCEFGDVVRLAYGLNN